MTASSMLGMGHHGTSASVMPVWLAVVVAVVFAAIAVEHLRYLYRSGGQRRPWHACHVLIATGMAFMYLSAAAVSVPLPAGFWRAVFACAGVLAALWALGGGSATSLLWLLTAVDLGVMIDMWSPGAPASPLAWLLVVYLLGQAGLWSLDAYRRIDGGTALISWSALEDPRGPAGARITAGKVSESLIGELEMGASMIAMALGMAFMLIVMR